MQRHAREGLPARAMAKSGWRCQAKVLLVGLVMAIGNIERAYGVGTVESWFHRQAAGVMAVAVHHNAISRSITRLVTCTPLAHLQGLSKTMQRSRVVRHPPVLDMCRACIPVLPHRGV